ncbi:MAG: hypothetical protein ACFFB0_11435 [Promethearchaeota archaeon]
MDLVSIVAIEYLVNIILSLTFASIIIHTLYFSKKVSKEKDFHLYNDLFSWEIFYIFIAIENVINICALFILINTEISNLILRIGILILFFPFWNKIIHLEKIMDKITYEKHYLAGMIPLILVIILGFTALSNITLVYIFLITTFFPFLFLLIFFKNTETPRMKTLKIISGALFIGLGFILQPEIVYNYGKLSEITNLIVLLINITTPISFIIGTLLIFDSFRRELNNSAR